MNVESANLCKDPNYIQVKLKVKSTNLCIDSYCIQVRMKVESTTFWIDPCYMKNEAGVNQPL
jgi:hypothetical protein